jgi:hypothetical protein
MASRGALEINVRVRERERAQRIRMAEYAWSGSLGGASTTELVRRWLAQVLHRLACWVEPRARTASEPSG